MSSMWRNDILAAEGRTAALCALPPRLAAGTITVAPVGS
jgi:hypothetical protein